jgi:hypothetical protein
MYEKPLPGSYVTDTDTDRLSTPTPDSIENIYARDVIGNKKDSVLGSSLYSLAAVAAAYVHSQSRVYPSLADDIVVTGGNAPWTLGNYVVLIPENAVDSHFVISAIDISACSTLDKYELVLYAGPDGSEIEVGRKRFSKIALANNPIAIIFVTEIIHTNSQVKAKLASKTGGNSTVTFSINYNRC